MNTQSSSEPPFGAHDILPDIRLPNEEGKLLILSNNQHGRGILLLLCPDPRLDACRRQLRAFAACSSRLEPHVHLYGVTTSPPEINAEVIAEEALPFSLLSDLELRVARGLGVGHNLQPAAGAGEGAFTTILTDANRRVLAMERGSTADDLAERTCHHIEALPRTQPRSLGHFAPILYLPQVLESALCQELIARHEGGETQDSRVMFTKGKVGEGEYRLDPAVKVRRDHFLEDPKLVSLIKLRFARRVLPEIEKAFTRRVTGVEEFKVVCYRAESGGHFRAHRDNVVDRHAHRRFAMTLNLNKGDYEGGELWFPEYGPDLYSPETGDAVVFSCSLLHEARPVTKGQRYVFLSFMFDEESRQLSPRFRRP
ncbi:MAG: 2OG-Fe(II) oxygenase [Pseudomonadota bacterium]